MRLAGAATAAVLVLASLAVSAQTYRCTGKDGKKYYEQLIPPQCEGVPIDVLNSAGQVIRRIDLEAERKQRLAKEADAAKKHEEELATKESARRNRALLATYTSEKDIDEARARALAENEKALKEVQKRIAEIKKRQAAFDKEMEFYKEGAVKPADKKGKAEPAKASKPPPKLLEDVRTAEVDLQAQEELLASKQKEVDAINAKYDEDKKRYVELTKRK